MEKFKILDLELKRAMIEELNMARKDPTVNGIRIVDHGRTWGFSDRIMDWIVRIIERCKSGEKTTEDFIEPFQQSKNDGRYWNQLTVTAESYCSPQTDQFLHNVIGMDLFSSIQFVGANPSVPTMKALIKPLIHGQRLECLCFGFIPCTKEIISPTCQALRHPAGSTLKTLRFFQNTDFEDGTISLLGQAIKENKSLLSLELYYSNLKDEDLATIANSSAKHPTLCRLDFEGNFARSKTLHALSRLLCNPQCKVSSLVLDHEVIHSYSDYIILQDESSPLMINHIFSRSLEKNSSLKKLSLRCNGLSQSDQECIFQNLWRFSCLEELALDYNQPIDSKIAIPRSGTLRKLWLDLQPKDDDAECYYEWLMQLVRANPLLGCIGQDLSKWPRRARTEIQHMLDCNRIREVIMSEPKPSEWPFILERIHESIDQKSPQREESVVYHFLREMGATLFISAPL